MIDFMQLENLHWYIQTGYKTKGAIKNGQSRDTGNMYTRHKTQDEDKQNKTHHDTGNQNDEQYELHKKPEVNPATGKPALIYSNWI
jgi:hypothetical protein